MPERRDQERRGGKLASNRPDLPVLTVYGRAVPEAEKQWRLRRVAHRLEALAVRLAQEEQVAERQTEEQERSGELAGTAVPDGDDGQAGEVTP